MKENNQLETLDYLRVFNIVLEQGEKKEDGYHWQGLRAEHDLDGYTCYLHYNDLTLTLYFHNKYAFDYQQEDTLERFQKIAKKLL